MQVTSLYIRNHQYGERLGPAGEPLVRFGTIVVVNLQIRYSQFVTIVSDRAESVRPAFCGIVVENNIV